MRFRTEPQSFQYDTMTNLVSGIIYADFGDFQFPGEHWEDFPIRLFAAWAGDMSDFVGSSKQSVELEFMDGPYLIKIERLKEELHSLKCLSRSAIIDESSSDLSLQNMIVGENRTIEYECLVSTEEILRQISNLGNALLAWVNKHSHLRSSKTVINQYSSELNVLMQRIP